MNEQPPAGGHAPAGATGVARGSLGTGTALDESTQELPIELQPAPPATAPPPPAPPIVPAVAGSFDAGSVPAFAAAARRERRSRTLPALSRRTAGLALAGLVLLVGGVAALSAVPKQDGGLAGAPPEGGSVTVPSTAAPDDRDDGDDGSGGGNGNGGGGNGNGGGRGNGNGNGNGGGGGND